MLARREVLAGGAGAAALLLPGCATVPLATGPSPCPPRMDVALDRVIRTQAGLRPFRPAGFRVEAEALGDRRLVHNYGHGGAGWTLAWGTARLALDAAGPHAGPVAVIGAGIAGLTTARLAQEAGLAVTIYAERRPGDTTSAIAGGQFHPTGTHSAGMVTATWRADYRRALDYAFRRHQLLVGDDWGVRWLTTYEQGTRPEAKLTAEFPPAARVVPASANPFGRPMVSYDTLYTETGRFMRRLLNEIEADGGRLILRRFDTLADVVALPERLVFNCTGLGARELVGDATLTPIKGQLAILLPQPEVRYALSTDAGYAFPRPDGIVLGGTWQRGEEDVAVDPAAISRVVERHRRFFADWRCPA